MSDPIGTAAVVGFGVQWICGSVAAYFHSEKFFDLVGSLTFLLLAVMSLCRGEKFFLRQKIQTGMVTVWALRLGLYLFSRIMADGSDHRFDKVRDKPLLFLMYWTIQGIWILVTLLPTLILNSKRWYKPLGARDYVGWGLWTVGFLLEAVADHQKSQFRRNSVNKGDFIRHGLWNLSRHPNYFGEILMWSGLYFSASPVMSGMEHASVISPVFVTILLTRVSGIPLLEKSALRRWGDNPTYQQYIKDTAVLVPRVW